MYPYIILFSLIIAIVGCFVFLHYKQFYLRSFNDKFKDIFIKSLALLAFAFILIATFIEPSKMISSQAAGSIELTGGCINLIGTPYGDNKIANFFAWFQIFLYFPCAFALIALIFFDIERSKNLLYFLLTPVLLLNAVLFFNLCNGMCGSLAINSSSVLLSIEVALVTSLAIIKTLTFIKENKNEVLSIKDTLRAIPTFLVIIVMFIPSFTFSVLNNPSMEFFGKSIVLQHATNFSFLHRFVLYITIIISVVIFALFKNSSEKKRKYILMLISASGIFSYVVAHSMSVTFINGQSIVGHISFNVEVLPFEIFNFVLILIPIAVILKKDTLFNICFFIALPILVQYVLFPRYASYEHVFNYNSRSYYHVSLYAFLLIALSIGYGFFKFPKLKKATIPLIVYASYFVFSIFINAWLTNYMDGYYFTDYINVMNIFNTNSSRLLKIFGDNFANKILSYRLVFTSGNFHFVFYYLYHIMLFFAYIIIFIVGYYFFKLLSYVGTSHALIYKKLHYKNPNKIIANNSEFKIDTKMALEINNLSKIYKGNKFKSLSNINLKIKSGEVVGLLGHNGAGKSTLIKCIVGQEDFLEGDIKAYGISNNDNSKEFKKMMGYIPDHYILYEDLTGREFVNYVADLYKVDKVTRRKNILYYLKLFNLTSSFDAKIETYSFGMKQKIAIMSTLIHDPKIWLLDEPLTGLDPESIYQIKKCIINHAKEGNVVLFSSHLIDLVEEVSTKIIILKHGKLIYEKSTNFAKEEYDNELEKLYMEKVGVGDSL